MNNYSNRIPNEEVRAAMRAKAFEMRLVQTPWIDVAKELGVSRPTATKLVQEYKDQLLTPLAEELRKVENDKLDRLEAGMWLDLDKPMYAYHQGRVVEYQGKPVEDVEARTRLRLAVVKVSESRRKMWGADLPVKTEHVVTTQTTIDADVKELVEQMNAEAEAEQNALGSD